MNKIEEKYFGRNEELQKQSAQVSSASPSLTFHSFAGLFLITGISTLLALFVSEILICQKSISMVRLREYTQIYLLRSLVPTETRVHPNDLHSTQGTILVTS
ncbi:hypothetical protein TSUD_201280 [Trifolium subterraneum]|uniref:Uncharacterized protein n=1 Tax=Trifolium subterraneum TaxID=3900 RepID=A0A2Z6LRC4_TRISU|nr:hypothetical protein TSUD_201280 [Trifolium subterraneum]